jgi:N-acetylglutamate synthase-like GNAT family acetyltransferase
VSYRRATAKDQGPIRSLILSVGINPRGLDWRRFIVAVDERDKVVGCGQVKPHPDGSRELASIAVRQKLRKKGVASEVIRRLMDESGPPLWLMCRASLVGFYERFGFTAGTIQSAAPFGVLTGWRRSPPGCFSGVRLAAWGGERQTGGLTNCRGKPVSSEKPVCCITGKRNRSDETRGRVPRIVGLTRA